MAYDNLRGRSLPIAKIAEMLSVHTDTVRRWAKAGHVKKINLGPRCSRIDGDSLADYLTAQTVGNAARPAALAPMSAKPDGRRKLNPRDVAQQA